MKSHLKFMRLAFSLLLIAICIMISSQSVAATQKPKLNVTKLKMTKNSQYTLRVYNAKKKHVVTFSSNSDAVTVKKKPIRDKSVLITAQKLGTSKITVTVKSNNKIVYRGYCNVTVLPSAVTIKFLRKNVTLEQGKTKLLQVVIKPNTSCETPTYTSSNPNVITVNSKGKITAIAPGYATITARIENGVSCQCYITVPYNFYPTNTPSYYSPSKSPRG
jgi:uncharacterized protein YjdB